MRVVVNPKYENLRPFIESILTRSYKVDKVYRNFRNIVEDTTVDGIHVVVKIFKKPTEANRVVYSFLRPTKAKRSYDYSLRLRASGIDVPEPVGYVEKNKGLFFHTGCYVCVYTDFRSISDFSDIDISVPGNKERLEAFMAAFAAYAADFHARGFVHNDFNIDNILYQEKAHRPQPGPLQQPEPAEMCKGYELCTLWPRYDVFHNWNLLQEKEPGCRNVCRNGCQKQKQVKGNQQVEGHCPDPSGPEEETPCQRNSGIKKQALTRKLVSAFGAPAEGLEPTTP